MQLALKFHMSVRPSMLFSSIDSSNISSAIIQTFKARLVKVTLVQDNQ